MKEATKPRPRLWKLLGIRGPSDPLVRTLPRLRVKVFGKRLGYADMWHAWSRLARNAHREGTIPLLVFPACCEKGRRRVRFPRPMYQPKDWHCNWLELDPGTFECDSEEISIVLRGFERSGRDLPSPTAPSNDGFLR